MSLRAVILVCLTLALGAGPTEPRAAGRSTDDLTSFLVQCASVARNGRPTLPAVGSSACPAGGLQDADTPLAWRKHDRTRSPQPGLVDLGYQVSDSVLAPTGSIWQTFDFGNADRRFGRFDEGQGDGGDLVRIIDGAAYVVFTEDGGGGPQWFVSEACRSGASPADRQKSWMLFASDVTTGAWTSQIMRLGIAKGADDCPRGISSAFTRYRRDTMTVPLAVVDGGRSRAGSPRIDAIVSEHYDNADIASSSHLERFYLGRGLGKFRWEAWALMSGPGTAEAGRQAAALATSGRCGPLPYSVKPGPGWAMVDCRSWTNLVRTSPPFSAKCFGWPRTADPVDRSSCPPE